jgi:endonuclease/exonuclease/phosphatase family metal-dependent hydrolase
MMTAAPAVDGSRAHRTASRLRALAAGLALACSATTTPQAAPGAQAAPGSVTFDLLSYNIRNLPGTGFDARRADVLAMLPDFDLVLLQEDFEPAPLGRSAFAPERTARGPQAVFRWYHLLAPFARAAGHPVPYDSGLSAMAPGPTIRSMQTITRHAYADCHGLIGASLDCWATKGLLGLRVELANGATVDVYTTHLDAGGHAASAQARRRQLEAMVRQIRRFSAGRAVILAGDFNAPPRRPDDRRALAAALAALDLTSAQALARNADSANCQVTHIFYRSVPGTRLEVLRAGEYPVPLPEPYADGMNFCSPDRRRYGPSDHPALTVTFQVAPI